MVTGAGEYKEKLPEGLNIFFLNDSEDFPEIYHLKNGHLTMVEVIIF